MQVYSKKIHAFVQEVKAVMKVIVTQEMGLKFKTYIFNQSETQAYRLDVAIFDNKQSLAYFSPSFMEIGLHKCLIDAPRKILHDTLRHELAHFYVHIHYGNVPTPHGFLFQETCRHFGWGDSVSAATCCIDGAFASFPAEENPVLRKVQKLMALSASSNQHEAELALLKSQELLFKHEIDRTRLPHTDDDDEIHLVRLLHQTRKNCKMEAICKILCTFFVSCIYRSYEGAVCLEVIGSPTNIEIASYVAAFLDEELERLWNLAKKMAPIKGITAKNSFLIGVAEGYDNKLKQIQKGYSKESTTALATIEHRLDEAQAMIYPNLTFRKNSRQHCSLSNSLGNMMGGQLQINPALRQQQQSTISLLT